MKTKPPTEIPWQEAQKWAKEHGMEKIIILCGRDDQKCPEQHVLTWGKSPAQSEESASYGNWLKDQIWPANKPHEDKPAWMVGLIEVWCAAEGEQFEQLYDAIQKHRAAIEAKIGKA